MAEHGEMNFEHEINEQLKKLDEKIIIPEIPDAQGIFELAEKPETKVIPFVNYRKIAGIAAAVVLVLASVPVVSGMLGISIGMDNAASEAAEEPAEAIQFFSDKTAAYDGIVEDVEEPCAAPEEVVEEEDSVNKENYPIDTGASHEENKSHSSAGKGIKDVLEEFFRTNSVSKNPATGGGDDVAGIAVSSMKEKFKKRSMYIEIDKDFVSVMLYDDSADGEIITAFWVEGIYRNSYEEDGKYYINTEKILTLEEVENDYYLPMLGDAEKGTYYFEEEKIEVPEKIVAGSISVLVEIDIATGEYSVSASVI